MEPGENGVLVRARVVAVHKERFVVTDGSSEIRAELAGRYLHRAGSALDLPTVGDWVSAEFLDDRTHAIIHDVLPRSSLMKRKSPGRNVDYQLIGANIDTAFVVQSLDHDFNPRRLERYLVMIHESGIVPVVLFSKSDLCDEDEKKNRLAGISDLLTGLQVITFSNQSGKNLDRIAALLEPEKTFCLVGSSGVGKSTLLNRLLGNERLETRAVRAKDSKGRHTTTARQLIRLPSGAMIIDTPGMRELGNLFVETGIGQTFAEIEALARQCRFSDCSHGSEKGCAIQRAMDDGKLSRKRFENYLAMQRESAFNAMSYREKREKDRAFGKMVRSVMKHKRRR